MPVTCNNDKQDELESESLWNDQHTNKVKWTILEVNKANKKMFKTRMDFLTKFIIFSIVIVRCAAAKGIEGLTIEN